MGQHQENTNLLPLPQHNWEVNFKARVLKSNEWDEQRHKITELYLNDSHSLSQVRKIMAEEHNFYANEAQYKKKIKAWELRKNLNKKTALALLEIQRNREINGKPTTFNYKGRLVRRDKLERSRKRFEDENRPPINGVGATSGEPSGSVVTPSGVEYFTPGSNSGDTESAERTVSEINDDVEGTGEAVCQKSEDTMMDIQDPDSPAITSLDAEDSSLHPSTSGVRNTSETIYQSVGDVGSIEETTSQNGRDVAIKDTGSHLGPIRLGDSNIRDSLLYPCPPQVFPKAKIGSSHVTFGFSEWSDEPIKIRSSNDVETVSAASDYWIGLGSAKNSIGNLVRNDVVMSEMSPFKTPSSVSSPYCSELRRGFEANCCGHRFHTTSEMINHYENCHTQQNHDLMAHRVPGNSSGVLASLPPAGGVNLLVDSEFMDMALPAREVDISKDMTGGLEKTLKNGYEPSAFLVLERYGHLLSSECMAAVLERASKNGHEAVVRLILRKFTYQLRLLWVEGWRWLLVGAAKKGHEAVVRLILQKFTHRLDLLRVEEPLVEAAKNGHEAVVQLILQTFTHRSGSLRVGKALVEAAKKGHEAVVRLIFQTFIHPLQTEEALVEAAKNGHEAVFRLILHTFTHRLGLFWVREVMEEAAKNGHEAVVRLILQAFTHRLGPFLVRGALKEAAKNGHEAVVSVILGNCVGQLRKRRCASIAAINGHEAVARLLLQEGTNPL